MSSLLETFMQRPDWYCQEIVCRDEKKLWVGRFRLLEVSEMYRDWASQTDDNTTMEDHLKTPLLIPGFDYTDVLPFMILLFSEGDTMIETFREFCNLVPDIRILFQLFDFFAIDDRTLIWIEQFIPRHTRAALEAKVGELHTDKSTWMFNRFAEPVYRKGIIDIIEGFKATPFDYNPHEEFKRWCEFSDDSPKPKRAKIEHDIEQDIEQEIETKNIVEISFPGSQYGFPPLDTASSDTSLSFAWALRLEDVLQVDALFSPVLQGISPSTLNMYTIEDMEQLFLGNGCAEVGGIALWYYIRLCSTTPVQERRSDELIELVIKDPRILKTFTQKQISKVMDKSFMLNLDCRELVNQLSGVWFKRTKSFADWQIENTHIFVII